MKILLVCLRLPFPPSDGGTIAMFNMANALVKAGAEVKIVSFNTKKHFVDLSKVPVNFIETYKPEVVYLDATVKPLSALFNLIQNKSYNISRFDSPDFHRTIKAILEKEQFDIIQLESLFMTPYINTIHKYSQALLVLRAHNVEYVIWERLALATKSSMRKWYLTMLASRLKKYEMNIIKKLDAIVVLTSDDNKTIKDAGCNVPVLVSPIGLDMEKYSVQAVDTELPSVFHLGSMDWMPNIEGVSWFIDHVYPLITKNNHSFKIFLAGKAMPDNFMKLANEQLVVSGRVDDSKAFMADKSIMIVPLLSGGGMRVKIIEGLAMGKTIISTTIGAEGIKYTNGKDILIADSPEEFYAAIVKCTSDISFCKEIGRNGRKLAENVYENEIIGKELLQFYTSITIKNLNFNPLESKS